MKMRLAFLLSVVMVFSTARAVMADAGPAISKDHSEIVFQNATDATIHINTIAIQGAASPPSRIVQPKSTVSFPVTSGVRKFSLTAYLANPVRIHTIALQLKENETSEFRIIPHMMGIYNLKDSDATAALRTPRLRGRGNREMGSATSKSIETKCKRAAESQNGFVFWRPGEDAAARHFRKQNSFLCSLDGREVYAMDSINTHFVCEQGWRNCRRNASGDAMFLPPVRTTSSLIDTPRRLAMADHLEAFGIQTRSVEWLDGNKPVGRITSYVLPGSASAEPRCPDGYRLHYQGFCINMADEMRDDPVKGVRGTRTLP